MSARVISSTGIPGTPVMELVTIAPVAFTPEIMTLRR
jgi:hypothetical protein